jgi:hypothetical protein
MLLFYLYVFQQSLSLENKQEYFKRVLYNSLNKENESPTLLQIDVSERKVKFGDQKVERPRTKK